MYSVLRRIISQVVLIWDNPLISFSNLFGPSPKKPAPPMVSIRYNSPQGDGDKSPSQRSNSLDSGSGGNITVAGGGGFGSEK